VDIFRGSQDAAGLARGNKIAELFQRELHRAG
jgi:hypothetical protein